MQNVKCKVTAVVMAVTLTLTVMAQDEEKKEIPQYFFPMFSESDVLLKDKQVLKQVLNYNTISEKMVYVMNGNYYDMMNPSLIDTVYLNNTRFVPVNKMFFEVLMTGDPALFIQHKSGLVTAGNPVGYGGTSQGVSSYYLSKHELSPEFINIQVPPNVKVNPEPVYWLRVNGELKKFENEKEFINMFPGKSKEIKDYIKSAKTKIENRDSLIALVRFTFGL